LDWRLPATDLERKVRAFNPFPVTYCEIDGQRVRIWAARVFGQTDNPVSEAGVILETGVDYIRVACGEGSLLLTEIQLPGRKYLPVAEVLKSRGNLFAPGNRFSQVE